MPILSGIHPVAEALRAKHPLERLLVAQGAGGPRLQELIDLARRAGVPVRFEPRPSCWWCWTALRIRITWAR